jgi:hypothetical protein
MSLERYKRRPLEKAAGQIASVMNSRFIVSFVDVARRCQRMLASNESVRGGCGERPLVERGCPSLDCRYARGFARCVGFGCGGILARR